MLLFLIYFPIEGINLKKLVLLTSLCSFVFANNIEILNENRQELQELEKSIIEKEYESSKKSWLSPLNLDAGISRSHSFSQESDSLSKTVSIGFSQSIYKSGGIEFTIKYADDKLKSDLLSWENNNNELYVKVYEIILDISKLNLEIEQSNYELKNKEIELVLKKIEYEAGKTDIIELNNVIMTKNTAYKSNVNLQNSLQAQRYELSKYTSFEYEQIEVLDFELLNKDDFLSKNIEIMYQESLANVLKSSYEKLKSAYLPNLSVSTSVSHSNNEDLITDETTENTSGKIALNFSMPLYDFTKQSTVAKSKIEYLKQKTMIETVKNEIARDFDMALSKVSTYQSYNKITEENLKLYDDLISVNAVSNQAGMSSNYDLEILQNTQKINQYDIEINNINIQQEYAKLYFKTKGTHQ